ncbi:hypothetical protein OSTOST_22096 [Ostertagia ostertagi]
MSILGASKANITKAITNWETVKGKIPASVFQSVDAQSSGSMQALELRRATIQSYLTQVRAAQRTLTEKRQAFLDVVKDLAVRARSATPKKSSIHESRVDGAIATAESIISSLSIRHKPHPYAIKKINGTTQRHLLRVTPLVRMYCRSVQSTRLVIRVVRPTRLSCLRTMTSEANSNKIPAATTSTQAITSSLAQPANTRSLLMQILDDAFRNLEVQEHNTNSVT